MCIIFASFVTTFAYHTLLSVEKPDSNSVSITCVAIIPVTPFRNDVDTSGPALMLVQNIV